MAVLPLRVEGLQLNDVQRLNLMVRQRAATRGGYQVQSERTTVELVEASQGLGLDCDVNDARCASQLGKIADVATVLVGRAVGGLDGYIGLDLRIIDVASAAERRGATAAIPAGADDQLDALNALLTALFDGSALATLSVTGQPDGAEVVVNGVVRGEAPLAMPIAGLAPGPHVIEARRKGYLSSRAMITVESGAAASHSFSLIVDPEAMRTGPTALQIAVPFIGAGVGAALAVTGAVVGIIGAQPYLAFEGHAAEIERLNQLERDAPGYATDAARAHENASAAARDWNGWGQPTFATGVALGVLGTSAAVAGVIWGSLLLMEPAVGAPE
jgi:hypothetical protein